VRAWGGAGGETPGGGAAGAAAGGEGGFLEEANEDPDGAYARCPPLHHGFWHRVIDAPLHCAVFVNLPLAVPLSLIDRMCMGPLIQCRQHTCHTTCRHDSVC
jgi:hypothetical protein